MPSFKWHTFWMAPCLISYFIVISFCIERKRFLMRNLATILPLKPKLSGKFQRFNAIDGSIKLLKKSWISEKIPVKIKNCKHFTRPKQQAASMKLSTSLEQNFSEGIIQKYSDICFQSTSRMQFLGVKKCCSANVFSDTKQKDVC